MDNRTFTRVGSGVVQNPTTYTYESVEAGEDLTDLVYAIINLTAKVELLQSCDQVQWIANVATYNRDPRAEKTRVEFVIKKTFKPESPKELDWIGCISYQLCECITLKICKRAKEENLPYERYLWESLVTRAIETFMSDIMDEVISDLAAKERLLSIL